MFTFKRIKHLNNFKTPKVEKMNLMFYRCEFLSSLNINGFQVSNNEIKKYIN